MSKNEGRNKKQEWLKRKLRWKVGKMGIFDELKSVKANALHPALLARRCCLKQKTVGNKPYACQENNDSNLKHRAWRLFHQAHCWTPVVISACKSISRKTLLCEVFFRSANLFIALWLCTRCCVVVEWRRLQDAQNVSFIPVACSSSNSDRLVQLFAGLSSWFAGFQRLKVYYGFWIQVLNSGITEEMRFRWQLLEIFWRATSYAQNYAVQLKANRSSICSWFLYDYCTFVNSKDRRWTRFVVCMISCFAFRFLCYVPFNFVCFVIWGRWHHRSAFVKEFWAYDVPCYLMHHFREHFWWDSEKWKIFKP